MQAGTIADTAVLAEAFTRGSAMKRGMLVMEGGVLSRDEFAGRIGLTPEELEAQPLLWLDVDGERVGRGAGRVQARPGGAHRRVQVDRLGALRPGLAREQQQAVGERGGAVGGGDDALGAAAGLGG